MRKLAIAVALSTTVLAGPALARDGAWYVGGDFGPTIFEDTDFTFTPGVTATTIGDVTVGFDEGFDGSGFVGYDFGAFRIEAEVSYKQTEIEDIVSNFALPGTAVGGGLFTGGSGDVNVLSGMINGMLDFGDDDGLSGFVGGGVGLARVDFNEFRAFTNTGTFIDESDTRFAWQIVAGVRQAISPNVDLHLRYRFFNVDDLESVGFGGRAVNGDLRTHSILGGITFNFGVPDVVVVCDPPRFLNEAGICVEPAPLPTPTPPPVICGPNERLVNGVCETIYIDCPGGQRVPQGQQCPVVTIAPAIVYFAWDEDDLDSAARGILDGVIQTYRTTGQAALTLAGHADRSGSATYNQGLSQRRANNVRDYLVAGGIPAGAISSQAFGESRPRVETADGVREPDNRRVEINFGPGSGW